MNVDLPAAASFMATHARMLDRRRFDLATGTGDPTAVLAALEAYRNADGGYGWGLEPDLRATESQPGCAYHAFETMAEAAAVTTPRAVELCDWLETVTLPDGGLPFAVPVADAAGVAPFWAGADPGESSLLITAYVAAEAHAVPGIEGHAWLARVTEYLRDAIRSIDDSTFTLALVSSARFLDSQPGVAGAFEPIRRRLPADGVLQVPGGKADEVVRPLDFSPYADRPSRELFDADVIAADLERLAGAQQDDGGWTVDYASYSPAAALEWRGYATVRAVSVLRRNGVL